MPTGTPRAATCASATDRGRVDRTPLISQSWPVEGSREHTSSTQQATSVGTSDEEPECGLGRGDVFAPKDFC
jgi:hypothetical protein